MRVVYNPSTQECGAGIFLNNDTIVTPVVIQKTGVGSTSFGTPLQPCGIAAIPEATTCREEEACNVNYPQMCPFTNACTNDLSKCAGNQTPPTNNPTEECSGPNDRTCGGICYDNTESFCFESEIYSKNTHFKCDDELYSVNSTQRCCFNVEVYNPNEQICGGEGVFSNETHGLCNGRLYVLAENDCSNQHIVDNGNIWDTRCKQELNPETHECQRGTGAVPGNRVCEIGQQYALKECYTPRSAEFGDECVANNQCAAGKCTGAGGLSKGECVCTSDPDCGDNAICKKGTLGIGKNECIATSEPTCTSGETYEIRNPLKRDRCNTTTTQTASLQCKLGTFNKKKNWTGPHAQSGADECRSTKNKDPKGVKCPSGYTHNITSGADTCTKTVVSHKKPSCPSDWDYKSQKGKDICQDK